MTHHHHHHARHSSTRTCAAGWRRLMLPLALAAAGALAGCDSLPARTSAGEPGGAREPSGITVYGTMDVGVQRQR